VQIGSVAAVFGQVPGALAGETALIAYDTHDIEVLQSLLDHLTPPEVSNDNIIVHEDHGLWRHVLIVELRESYCIVLDDNARPGVTRRAGEASAEKRILE
jgi:creatinine amidohydrolase/Fe(II)-dependent formamide hydrolase-like protein